MNEQASLFDPPRARTTDPATSHGAITDGEASNVERAVLNVFRPGVAYTDDELAHMVDGTVFGPTVKTARSRLTNRGLIVDTGIRRPSDRGRPAIVWTRA